MEAAMTAALRGYDLARTSAAPGTRPDAQGDGDHGLAAAASEFMQVMSRHEETARAAMTGDADPHALVEALAASQLAIETVAALRDRMVEAYQEVLRMPV